MGTAAAATIREAVRSDVPPVLALWRIDDVAASRTDDEEALEALEGHPTSTLLVAEAGGTIVGSMIVGWDGWRGELYRLVVAPSHRRNRVATELVRAGERRLLDQGARRISVLVLEEADAAAAFWRSVGYEQHDGMSRFVRVADGSGTAHAKT